MEQVPDNVPEVAQYVDLVRAVARYFNLPPIPPTLLVRGSTILADQLYATHDQEGSMKNARLHKELRGDAAALVYCFGDDQQLMLEREMLAGFNTFVNKGKRTITKKRMFPLPGRRQHDLPKKPERSLKHQRLAALNQTSYELARRSWSRAALSSFKLAETPWYQWQHINQQSYYKWCGCYS
jgi:hypothetical protein